MKREEAFGERLASAKAREKKLRVDLERMAARHENDVADLHESYKTKISELDSLHNNDLKVACRWIVGAGGCCVAWRARVWR